MAHRVHASRRVETWRRSASATSIFGDAFSAVFETSEEALLLIDTSGTIRRTNARARELLRLSNATFREAALHDVLSGSPADLAALWSGRHTARRRSLDASLAIGLPVRVTLRAVLPGSKYRLLSVEDASIMQRAKPHRCRAAAELGSVLDSIHAAIIIFDPTGRVRCCNARFAELFGFDPGDLESVSTAEALEDLLAPRFRSPETFAAPWRAFLAGVAEPGYDHLDLMRPSARVIERFSRPVVDVTGDAVGWLEVFSERTAERQMTSTMLQTEKMAALGQLVSGIAHELNNPLTTIMGYAQLLLGHGLKPPQHAEAGRVYQEAERARSIVKNLLYFARENPPERELVPLNDIVEQTLALRSYELRFEDIAVERELDPALPETMADPHQLQQVILNLIVNAEQALLEARGHGRIRIRTYHVSARSAESGNGRIVLEVDDDGPGILPKIARRVFDPFFTTKPEGVGTGLGLSIVYGIVNQHGGKVTVESQPGAGTKFRVELPVVPAPPGWRATGSPDRAQSSKAVSASRILVIEDEPTVAQLVVDVLREEGHDVDGVLESSEGLNRLVRGRYDLLICDLRMPRLDGQAIYETLARTADPIRDRILFITGDVLAPRTLDFLERNALPYLTKPFLVEELKLAANRLLSRKNEGCPTKQKTAER